MYKTLTIKEYERMSGEYDKVKYVCKHCGHKTVIPNKVEKRLCSWCGNYVFKNEQDEFRFRLNEKRRNYERKDI